MNFPASCQYIGFFSLHLLLLQAAAKLFFKEKGLFAKPLFSCLNLSKRLPVSLNEKIACFPVVNLLYCLLPVFEGCDFSNISFSHDQTGGKILAVSPSLGIKKT